MVQFNMLIYYLSVEFCTRVAILHLRVFYVASKPCIDASIYARIGWLLLVRQGKFKVIVKTAFNLETSTILGCEEYRISNSK